MAMPEEIIRAAPTAASPKLGDGQQQKTGKFVEAGVAVKSDAQPDDLNFLFRVSSNQVDLANDVIQPAGIDCSIFNQNPTVLNCHDSSVLPIATSSAPWVSGSSLMAIAKFPQPGVNADSDQVAAAIQRIAKHLITSVALRFKHGGKDGLSGGLARIGLRHSGYGPT
jgi:hypothetical protein